MGKILTPFSSSWERQPTDTAEYSRSALDSYNVVGGFVVDTGYIPKLVTGGVFTNIAAQGPFLPSYTDPTRIAARCTDAGIGRYYTFGHSGFDARNFTFLTRLRINDVGSAGTLLRNLPIGTGTTIPLWRNGTNFDMRINSTDYTAAGTFNMSQWYDIEIVGTGSACTMYVDDSVVIAGTAAAAGTVTTDFAFLDLSNTSGWNEFGHLLFCGRSLSAQERRNLRMNPWQLFTRNTLQPIPTRLPKRNI